MAWNNITRAKSKSRDDINTYLNDIELIEQEFNDLLQTLDRNKRTAMQTDAVYDPFAEQRYKTSVSIPIQSSRTLPPNSVLSSVKNGRTSTTSHRTPNKYRKQKFQKIYRSRSNDKVYQDFPSHGRENLAVFEVPSKLKRGRGSWFDDSIDRVLEFQRRLDLLNFDNDVRDLSQRTQLRDPYSENLESSLDYGFETGYCSDETTRPQSVMDVETKIASGSTNYSVQRRPINNFWKRELAPPKMGANSVSSMTKASSLSNSTIDIPMRSSCNRSSTIGSEFSFNSSANCSPSNSVTHSNSTVILTETPPRKQQTKTQIPTPLSKYRSRSTSSLHYQQQRVMNSALVCKVCKTPLTGREIQEDKAVHDFCLNLVCPVCDQVVFCMEEVCVEDQSYHSWCSKCYICGRSLNNANVNTLTLDNDTLVLSCKHCLRQYVTSKSGREKPITEANLWVSDVQKTDFPTKQPIGNPQKDPIHEEEPIPDNIWNHYMPPISRLSADSYWKKPASNIVSLNTPPNRRSMGSVYQADSNFLSQKTSQTLRHSSQRKVDRKGVCCVCSDDILWDESSDLLSGERLAHWVCIRNICPVCIKKVHPFDGWSSHGRMYHSLCFKCHLCGGAIAHGKEAVKKDLRGYRRLYHSACAANAGKQAFSKLF